MINTKITNTKITNTKITNTIKYIGVNDKEIDMFESQYIVKNGMSYNSYIILDEKIAIMDTVDHCKVDEWLANLINELEGKMPDYLVCLHMEPDHAGSVAAVLAKYPNMQVVGNAKTFVILQQFFGLSLDNRRILVKEGDVLDLGQHKLHFIMAPMVHWPEVMVAYEENAKVLFAADAFGKFGALDIEEPWIDEARRYYFNIVGKYGAQVQALLKKVGGLDIQTICSLHGPILTGNIPYYIEKYDVWSSYRPEDKGIFIAYASIHGNTKVAAYALKELIENMSGDYVEICDLSREDKAYAVECAFRYDRMVVMAASYDGGVFPCMESFLHHLKSKNYQKRRVGIVENGSWAPCAAKTMRSIIEPMKEIEIYEPVVTIKSALNEESHQALSLLAKEIVHV